MTDDRIEKMMLASLAEVREPRLWDSLTYESGPYSINKLKVDALKLGRVFARAVLAEQAEPVAWVPRCIKDCEYGVEGELRFNELDEKPFSVADPECWECAPLYITPPTAGTVRVPVEPTHELRQLSFTILSRLQSGTEEVVRLDDAEAALASERSRTAALEDALRWIEGETHSTPGLTIVELGVVMARIGARARASLIAAAPK